MYGENGLTETSWWWVSTPRATGGVYVVKGTIAKTPPYFSFIKGRTIEDVISDWGDKAGFLFLKLEGYHEEKKQIRDT